MKEEEEEEKTTWAGFSFFFVLPFGWTKHGRGNICIQSVTELTFQQSQAPRRSLLFAQLQRENNNNHPKI